MGKIHREGVDVSVALSAGLNNFQARDLAYQSQVIASEALTSASFNSRIKRYLRKVLRVFFWFAKRLFNPFFFRLRRYFLSGINQVEIIQTLQQKLALTQAQVDQLVNREQKIIIPCDNNEILLRTELGYLICNSKDYALLAFLIETSGDIERGTRLLIQRFLKPNDTFLDVGAQIGLHTLSASRALAGKGKIFAFEPFPNSARLLKKILFINGQYEVVEVHEVAVSNKSGQTKLFLGETCSNNSLYPLDTPDSEWIEVKLVTLDEFLPQGQKVNLIKIDVEGAELDVIEGAKSIIKNNHDLGLIVEFGLSHLKRVNQSIEEWLKAFEDLGLCYKVINPDNGMLETYSLDELAGIYSINLFFARKNSMAWDKAKP